VAWGRTGRFLVYDSSEFWISHLWRVEIDGATPPQRLEIAGLDASNPATSMVSDQVIFTRGRYDGDVFLFQPGRDPKPVVASSFWEGDADISPDGARVAFDSVRSNGRFEIWVANIDGSHPQQLTNGPGSWQGSPHWSPDGRRIAFNSLGDDRQWHIWTIDADGGSLEQISQAAGLPTWSADGRWIYYTNASGIWRIEIKSRVEQHLIHAARSLKAFEWGSPPTVVYQSGDEDGPLFLQPLADGPRRQIASCAHGDAFYARPSGIYYVGCEPRDPTLHLANPVTGQDQTLGSLAGYSGSGFNSISAFPNEKAVLYQRALDRISEDLMLIENFK